MVDGKCVYPDGSELIWASYLGGSDGENPHSLITNAAGELVVLGSTTSTDFPVTDGAFDETSNGEDITVTHISFDGTNLIGSTYVGGSGSDGTNVIWGNYGETYRGEVFVDATGNILVASFSSSSDFPVTSGALQSTLGGGQDGVIVKLNPACTQVIASTFVGGPSDDSAMGIRIASNGDYFVIGSATGTGLPLPAGGYMPSFQGGTSDGYVIRVNSDLTMAMPARSARSTRPTQLAQVMPPMDRSSACGSEGVGREVFMGSTVILDIMARSSANRHPP